MDAIDKQIINALQGGFPICARPFAQVAEALGLEEQELIDRIEALIAEGVLSRFGPMINAERLGGAVSLAALSVPEARFDEVAAAVNAFPEVAHNYARTHQLNMWFVVACETADRVTAVIAEIERAIGLPIFNMPKEEEYFLELKLSA